jgi:hypothetical protein
LYIILLLSSPISRYNKLLVYLSSAIGPLFTNGRVTDRFLSKFHRLSHSLAL